MWTQYDNCVAASKVYGLDTIVPRLQLWLQAHLYATFMLESSAQFNRGDIVHAFETSRQGIQAVVTARFTEDEAEGFNQWEDTMKGLVTEQANALTFGYDGMDTLLLPGGKGGLLLGDTTVLLAPTNVGKTTCQITIACANIRNGKDLLFINHEGRTSDLKLKFLRCLSGLSSTAMMNAYRQRDDACLQRISQASEMLNKHMLWLPMCQAGYTVEALDSVVRRKVDEWAQRRGRSFDMLVDDYPAILTTEKASKGNLAKRHIDDLVYKYFVQWALEFNFHSLVAIQGNRESSKVNKGQRDNNRLLSIEDVSEAFGPMQTATNAITLNRDPTAMAKGFITYYICKSRSNETGWAVTCKSDYPTVCTHSNKIGMGGFSYRGDVAVSDKIDDLLREHLNKVVPDGALVAKLNAN
jgi:hypothetical protein